MRVISKLVVASLLLLTVYFGSADAQPKAPYWNINGTPCEYCMYGEWKTKEKVKIKIYQSAFVPSEVAFELEPDYDVQAETGVVITTKVGYGIAQKDLSFTEFTEVGYEQRSVKIAKNEKFYIYDYLGEGFYNVWYKGRFFQTILFDDELKIVERPEYEWWVLINSAHGQIGWTKEVESFKGPRWADFN